MKDQSDVGSLTNISTPTIDIIAAGEANTINIYKDSVLLGQASLVNGTLYEYTFTEAQLAEGSNIITARSFDGIEESVDSSPLEIMLDTSGPQIIARKPGSPVNILIDVLDFVTVTFNEAIDYDPVGGGSFTIDDMTINGPEGVIILSDTTSLVDNEYEISFDPQTSKSSRQKGLITHEPCFKRIGKRILCMVRQAAAVKTNAAGSARCHVMSFPRKRESRFSFS